MEARSAALGPLVRTTSPRETEREREREERERERGIEEEGVA